MIIAIDFDGVLITHPHSLSFSDCLRFGKPTKNSVEVLNYLSKFHELYVLTSRTEHDRIKDWLWDWGFPEMEVTNVKKPASVYVDDRALRFTNWTDISKYLK